MAGGKLSARQKMINMMYLVLTAMLALNVSKDILKALTKLDESLTETISTVQAKNDDVYNAFNAAAAEDPVKAGKWKDKAYEVKDISDKLFAYIEEMKDTLVVLSGGYEDEEKRIPKALDAKSKPLNYLVAEQGPKKAEELKAKIEKYRDELITIADKDPKIKANLETVFNTDKQKEGDKEISWEEASFGEYPLGAIIPFLTDIQARVRNSESEVITLLRRNITEGEMTFNTVKAMVNAPSNYITQGDVYEADVFLAAYDNTQNPKIIINGEELPVTNIQNGIGKVRIPANSVGEQKWGGQIIIKQIGKGEVPFPIPEQSFTVAPQSVVISPSKMNVLYRGVDNPLEIGVPGVEPSKIRVSGPGVRQVKPGEYIADVTGMTGQTEVTISVSVAETDADGKESTRPAGTKKFRIKGLPPAVGTIYKRTEGLFSANAIANATVEARFEDFVFDLDLDVVSFELAIPGSPPVRVNGDKVPSSARAKILNLRPGATVTFRNIKAKPKGNSKVRVDRVATISVDVN
ncbi:type IX secretion system motor protein PorM/GldM [Croceimicrobium hydrocarbonivorans]|uniref:Gliding motility protein GldM n=1 Tax=Croceimicrobium hydrocarbonivorans TaxID=2761580 RepID=A0A7H0VI49_9FLAO|nr:gliding motility protein GldM [Croceimicrobium hydrocarbonivorans]QNR25397.1 gliding motility protein GldM [Croceimicrobium hydrocarbonivorans]